MTLQDSETTEAETQSAPEAPKPDRRTSRIDADKRTVTITDGGATSTYGLDSIPEQTRTHLALIGLRQWLWQRDDAGVDYDQLVTGDLGVETRAAAKPKALRPWQEAIAQALADEMAKQAEVKRSVGGKELPAFTAILADARTKVATMDRTALNKARLRPAVIAHHARIVGGASGSLLDLLNA